MSMLQLLIEPVLGTRPRTRITVDDQMVIGTCVSWLVSRLGYPKADSAGTPVAYRLRPLAGGAPLPNTARFADVRLPSGVPLALECEMAEYATIPIGAPPRGTHTGFPLRISRRALLSAAPPLALCALAGLGTGLTAGIAQSYLSKRRTAVPTSQPGQTQGAPSPRSARVQFTFTAHQQTVRALAWSPDGTWMASGGDDAQLLVWSTDGAVLARLPHPAPVAALSWSPDSQRLVSGAANQVTFFAVSTGAVLARSTHRHTAPVTGLSWAAHGMNQVASSAADQRVIIWETAHYQAQTVFTKHDTAVNAVSFAADGQTVASASQGGAVRVWLASTGQEVHPFYWDAHLPMRAIAFAPAGMLLAVGGEDGVIRLWNGAQCQMTSASSDGIMCSDVPQRLRSRPSAIRALAWSPDGQYLLSGSEDGVLALWFPSQSQQPLFQIPPQIAGPVESCAWSPSGKQFAATSGNSVVIWTVQT